MARLALALILAWIGAAELPLRALAQGPDRLTDPVEVREPGGPRPSAGGLELHLIHIRSDMPLLIAFWLGPAAVRGEPGPDPSWRWMCGLPCETDVPEGVLQLAIRRAGHDGLLEVADPVSVRGPGQVHIRFEDQTDLRAIGWLFGSAGFAAASGLIIPHAVDERGPGDEPLAYGIGIASAVVGLVFIMALSFRPDRARARFEPHVSY